MVREFPTTGRILVILDALDECLTDRSIFLKLLISLAAEELKKLRFFATSRKEQDISEIFDKSPDVSSLWMSVEGDIKKFVIRSVNELPCLKAIDCKDTIIQDVTKNSAGMFQYGGLMIEEFESSLLM